jgi:hypothetical protein
MVGPAEPNEPPSAATALTGLNGCFGTTTRSGRWNRPRATRRPTWLTLSEPGGYEESAAETDACTEEQRKDPKVQEGLRRLDDFQLPRP